LSELRDSVGAPVALVTVSAIYTIPSLL